MPNWALQLVIKILVPRLLEWFLDELENRTEGEEKEKVKAFKKGEEWPYEMDKEPNVAEHK